MQHTYPPSHGSTYQPKPSAPYQHQADHPHYYQQYQAPDQVSASAPPPPQSRQHQAQKTHPSSSVMQRAKAWDQKALEAEQGTSFHQNGPVDQDITV